MAAQMEAMRMNCVGQSLMAERVSRPVPNAEEILLKVEACGVCRTDLHILDGDLSNPELPLILGHEVVGRVVEWGERVEGFTVGQRAGVPWLGWTCGTCPYCSTGRENLCPEARFTGYQLDGGYAAYAKVNQRYCFTMDQAGSAANAAPLLCAGLIGYRSLKRAGDANRLGIYGFGAAAHIVVQVAVWEGRQVYAFTRPGDLEAQALASRLGCVWVGSSLEDPPDPLDAAIIFAPIGPLVPTSLRSLAPGGRVVCAGIHMSDIPAFPYEALWGEREIVSVANLTRSDGIKFLNLAPQVPIRTTVTTYPLADANRALEDLRAGRITGAAVLEIDAFGTSSFVA